ncbi:MAG: TetR/AcrR family transcriptional regulator [Lachnospiraceae bacterium]|nr:TetR/AcrR family transcriptional regulator [Lachnospiraceae bacterium]
MNAKFFDLKQEKQDRMINAALKIFAINGYKHASTDDIVKEAGISKGLLFHYFDSKIGVYSFLYDYSARYMTLELSSAVDPSETSYMEIRRQMEAARMQTLKTYPYMELFLKTAAAETSAEAVEATGEAIKAYRDSVDQVLSKADMTSVNSAKNSAEYLKMLDYTTEGIMREHFSGDGFDAQSYYKEVVTYINLVEKLLK